MPKRRREPVWLSRVVVDSIHTDQLREHGGLVGIRDLNALESALARPLQKWAYDENSDLASLAAAYDFGLVKNHPYRDGNKRVGVLSMVTFLGLNGRELRGSDSEILTIMLALADGRVAEPELAEWLRGRLVRSE